MDTLSLDGEVARFLNPPRYAVIATHDPDGAIWQAVVWYALTGEGILMNARNGRRWLSNLRRDPRLSFVVEHGEDYVMLRGEATVIDDPVRGLADALMLAKRYRSDETFAGQDRVDVLFHPARVAVHGEVYLDRPAT